MIHWFQRLSNNLMPFLLNDLSLASKYASVSDITSSLDLFPLSDFWGLQIASSRWGPDLENRVGAEAIRSAIHEVLPTLRSTLWYGPYASHGAQCCVTISHSTCGYCVRDYHISFWLFALSNPSVPTLCSKDSRGEVDSIQLDLPLTVR